jgi:acyl carrier protein
MTNNEKLVSLIAHTLMIDVSIVTSQLQYNSIGEWDSVGHMALIAALEECFDVMLDTDDIIELSSVEKAKEILIKYGVIF